MNQMLLFRGQKNQRTETLSNDPKSHSSRGTFGRCLLLLHKARPEHQTQLDRFQGAQPAGGRAGTLAQLKGMAHT